MATRTTTRSRRKAGEGTTAEVTPAAFLDDAELERLKLSPEVAWYLTSRGIPLPDCPPLIKTPEPRDVAGARFDPERVDKVIKSFSLLRHTQGQWAGRPLVPDPWQVAWIIAPVFGWVRFDADADMYVRIITDLYVDVPRKNGKSTLSGGLAIYLTCADGEPGAQVIAAATTKQQAGYVFTPIRQLAERAPALKGHVKPYRGKIIHPKSGSYFEVIASVADAQHGANLHGAVIDELHVHKDPEMVEVIETGTGSRRQPLIVIITTADSGKPETIYNRKRTRIEQLARGVLSDPSVYGVVWAVPKDADPFVEATWRAANPGFGISPTRSYLERKSREAQQSPADLAKFQRLHLGLRTKQVTKYLTLESWRANLALVDEAKLKGREAYGGLDLGAVSDLNALAWLFPDDTDGGLDLVLRFWTPEDNLASLDKRTAGAASRWVKEGWLKTTTGNVTDYDAIGLVVRQDLDTFDVKALGFDRWSSTSLTNDLEGERAPMVGVGQGFKTMSPALKAVKRLLLSGERAVSLGGRPMLRHAGNLVMTWMVDNLAVAMDAAGNVKPDKASAADKIDGVSALCDAMSEVLARPPKRVSAYEDSDFEAI
ncbi:phage terminase (large subunit) [Streptomyces scabiei 87.22]|uniref:Phage terminase (Large subunit) n=1 Tax=Streptomyces scabiei (strain 87.22) TaxID=680198 RepID=C9ZE58_STRSW|nr:terminase TerL endonuclease subunit [Streptomyces scabiei]MDX3078708.1 terminase large subunit [Streptomyces scabiei]MDX3271221.1 terminase large subunit [Streptomyces scabiei]MDX3394949.1 terminase large subunit [Streptomyces scabiei]CBG73490.1 phage terminase (large subunit) [Streptomyces scabiei 87.22]